jgi:putative transposase
MPFWRIFFHLVWGTKLREPRIDDAIERIIQQSIRATCEGQGVQIHGLGMMPDHLHLAVAVPPRIAVADLVKLLKGSSSHLVNTQARTSAGFQERFYWQEEYGVLSFGERSLADVVAYVENQREHHANKTILPVFEQLERPFNRERG